MCSDVRVTSDRSLTGKRGGRLLIPRPTNNETLMGLDCALRLHRRFTQSGQRSRIKAGHLEELVARTLTCDQGDG